ncbi:MAG: type II toxin-antitoxin system Phd/YefM family antitoxin [Acidobacteriota bacterium]
MPVMRRIHLKEDIKPVTEFRANAATLIEQIRETKRALVLTQRGHSAAVVVDVGEYERMVEELELLRDIHAAEEQLTEGRGIGHGEARQQVLKALGE